MVGEWVGGRLLLRLAPQSLAALVLVALRLEAWVANGRKEGGAMERMRLGVLQGGGCLSVAPRLRRANARDERRGLQTGEATVSGAEGQGGAKEAGEQAVRGTGASRGLRQVGGGGQGLRGGHTVGWARVGQSISARRGRRRRCPLWTSKRNQLAKGAKS